MKSLENHIELFLRTMAGVTAFLLLCVFAWCFSNEHPYLGILGAVLFIAQVYVSVKLAPEEDKRIY
jgi:hypothetical protein